MSALSSTPPERARKIASAILQRMNAAEETQAALAVALGVSGPTVHRLMTDHLSNFSGVLAHLGLKVVPADYCCVRPETYAFLTETHARVMAKAPQLVWDSEIE